jgi:2-alkenal reductase
MTVIGDTKKRCTQGDFGGQVERVPRRFFDGLIQPACRPGGGINTLVIRGSGSTPDQAEGLGFAIASNIAQAAAQQLIEHGFVSRPYLGISWQPITPQVAQANSLPVDWGVYVTQVSSGSPAAAAGLQKGDIVTKIGAVALDEQHPFTNALWDNKVGDSVAITVLRGTQTLTVNATLGERPHG